MSDSTDAGVPIIGETPPVETLSQTIARLLAESRAAHTAYRWAQRQHDMPAVNKSFQKAARLRAEAHALDPEKTASAWQSEPEKFNHDDVLDFYAQQITR